MKTLFAAVLLAGGRGQERDGRARRVDIIVPDEPSERIDCQLGARLTQVERKETQ
jgi:hypothetical protein